MRCGHQRFGKLLANPLTDRNIDDRFINVSNETINDISVGRGLMDKAVTNKKKRTASVLIKLESITVFVQSHLAVLVMTLPLFVIKNYVKPATSRTTISFRPPILSCFNQCGFKVSIPQYFIAEWLSWIRMNSWSCL